MNKYKVTMVIANGLNCEKFVREVEQRNEWLAEGEAIDKLKEHKETEPMSQFEKAILFERYHSAIRICNIILEKWEESFPEYDYFPTAKLWKKWRLVKTMDAATETYRDKNYCMLKLHTDDLWEYINGGQEEKATTITKLRYSRETIVASILKHLPKAEVRFINQGQTVYVDPGDGREPAQFSMDYIQKFNIDWLIGTEIFGRFRNKSKGYI